MKFRILLAVLILLFSSIAYSDEYSDSYYESDEKHFDSEDFDEDDFKKYRKEGMEFNEEFVGPGGCKSKEECMKYCMEHMEECMKYKGKFEQGFPDKEYYEEKEFKEDDFYRMKEMMPPPMHPMMFMPEKIDPTEIIMYKIFEKAKGMNPKEFMQYCPDAEKLVEEAIKRLNEEGIQLKSSCEELKKYIDHCKNRESECEKIKQGHNFYTDEKLSCSDLTEEKLFNKCAEKHEKFRQGEDTVKEQCRKNFEMMRSSNPSCNSEEKCDEQEFLNKCRTKQEQRCNELAQQNQWPQESVTECINSHDCNSAWSFQRQNCEFRNSMCDEEKFIQECIERSTQGFEAASENKEENCRRMSSEMYSRMKEMCSMNEKMYNECLERSSQACSKMEEAIAQCESITEDQIKAKMIEHAKFMCEMKDMMMRKMGEKGIEGVIPEMMMLKEDMPEDMKIVMDAETKKLYELNKEIEENKEEGGGIFKEILRLLGILSKKEKERASKLKEKAEDIQESIDRLTELSNQVSDPDVKAALLLQIEKLEEKKDELEEIAEEKGLLTGFATFIKNFEL